MAALTSYLRLPGALWALLRADALAPKEAEPLMPPGWRLTARALRAFAGPKARAGRPGERLALALEGLGPVAIKFGQFLSTRGDIIGAQAAEDLGRLKDRLAPFPTELARAHAEAALGAPLESLFASFGEPIAAASLAQAHEARLIDGRRVAVKLLRPQIERRVARDIAALELAAALVQRWVPAARRLEPVGFAATVARALALELDLRLEAAGADELRQAMAQDGYMSAPKVVWEGVGRRVLTLEWAVGRRLSDPDALDGLDRAALAANLVRGFLAQALKHGVFHADLHEGNLFVSAPDRLVAVDFGIIGRLSAAERRYLAEILWGFLTRDYDRVASAHFRAGYVAASHDRGAFAQALRAVGEPVIGRTAAEVSMGRLLTQLFDVTALFDMRLRPELVLLQKTMIVAEGVARRIWPQTDMWQAAEPVVRRWMARELSPITQARALARDARLALAHIAAPPNEIRAAETASRAQRGLGAGWAFLLGIATAATVTLAAAAALGRL
ncbi:MAG TPA: 2-polyprenylphenol 6-hydroxylase [Caulobacteraceae bacterium]|nr:2-polyprenylphenol 6-hydroxylase [Caulobacteraceae bacterium]